MAKRALFTTLVLSGFVITLVTGQCFGDALGQLEKVETYKWYPAQAEQIYQEITRDYPGSNSALTAHKNLIISYRSAKRHDDVQQALDDLVRDFSGHPSLPAALYDIARIYERSREYEKANNIFQQIIQQDPNSSAASKAQIANSRITVLSHIESKDDDAAAAAIDSLITNFAGHSELPMSLYYIARRYERTKEYDKKAKGLYQQIIQQYPESSAAGRAQLAVRRTAIYSLIESGEPSAVQAAIDGLIADFPGHPDMSEALFDIAGRCEKAKNYEQAKSIYQQVIQQYPDSPHAARAKIITPKLNIFSLIESAGYSEAGVAVDKLIADFAGHSHLAVALGEIARRYEKAEKYEEAGNVYQQIVQRYPGSWYASKAELGVPKNQILFFIDSGEHSEATGAIDKLVSDFSGNPGLPWVLSDIITGKYYSKARQLENEGLDDKARIHFQKTTEVYEMVINRLSGSAAVPEICCPAGDSYTKLGEHTKALDCYQKVGDDYSGYRFAWHALFMVGRSYESLKEAGLVSESEADLKTKAAYQQLLEKYPDCKVAEYAQSWIGDHSSE